MRRNTLALVAMSIIGILVFVVLVLSNQNDWAERDADFLRKCAAAGYDAAKCQFFLAAAGPGRGNNDAAVQMIIQSATH
jgi:hypothetical protein